MGLRSRWAVVPAVVVLVAYVAVVGLQPSVVRATAMALVMLAGLLLGGGAGMTALLLSIVALLVADPWLAGSRGFALSCAATAGLLVAADPARRWVVDCSARLPPWARGPWQLLLAATLTAAAAGIATAPLLAAYGRGLSFVSVVANVARAPMVPVVTVSGLLVPVWRGCRRRRPPWSGRSPKCRASGPAGSFGWRPSARTSRVVGSLAIRMVVGSQRSRASCSGSWRWEAMALAAFRSAGRRRNGQHRGGLGAVGDGDDALPIGDSCSATWVRGRDAAAYRSRVGGSGGHRSRSARGTGLPASIRRATSRCGDLEPLPPRPRCGPRRGVGGFHPHMVLVSPLDEPADTYADAQAVLRRTSTPSAVPAVGQSYRVGGASWVVLGPAGPLREGSAPNNTSVTVVADVVGVDADATADADADRPVRCCCPATSNRRAKPA